MCTSLSVHSTLCEFHYKCTSLFVHATISALHYLCSPLSVSSQVVAGAHNIKSILPEENIQKRHVSAMWKHENYDHTVITNDVSLLKLDEPLEFNEFVQPLPLAPAGDDPAGGTVCVNSGWGSISHTSAASMPATLQVQRDFSLNRSLGRFSLCVAMSVCRLSVPSVYLFIG